MDSILTKHLFDKFILQHLLSNKKDFERKFDFMNMELYEIWRELIKISDDLLNQRIEYSYDPLMGVIGACRPSESLDLNIIPKIDWDSPSPDMDKLTEALEELIEFNKCFNIKELKAPIKELKKYLSENA